MNERDDVPHPLPPDLNKEEPIDVQRRAIRAAVRKRLRGEIERDTRPDQHSHQKSLSTGEITCDAAYNPLVYLE